MPSRASASIFFFWVLNAFLGVAFIVELSAPHFSSALDAVTIVLAAAASVAALQRQLPLQNILPAAGLTALIGGVAHGLSSWRDVALPLGPIGFSPTAGAKIFHTLPWIVPLLWIVAVFNARGVSRLILRPWRKVKNYGYWLIGLTTTLAVAFDVALEPYAWHVKSLWRWTPTKLPVSWQGTPLLNFLGWAGVVWLIMMLVTPLLIRKQAGSPSAPDWHPLAVWLGALLLFAAGAAGAGLWWPLAVDAVIAGVTTVLAVRGAKW